VTIRFVDEARREFLDAVLNYEEARPSLGQRFKDEVDRSILWIADHPELSRLRPGSYRRLNLRVFPYYIPYIIRGQTLWILAVAHASRKPLYWIFRRNEVGQG
jgi:plasmid stabilization system protein ParE